MARLMLPKMPDKASFGVKSCDKDPSRAWRAEGAIVKSGIVRGQRRRGGGEEKERGREGFRGEDGEGGGTT